MMYGITCKPEYWNTWPLMLKEELTGFATVEIVHPAQKRTIPESMNSITSPSGNFIVDIDPMDCVNMNEINVYVVSDGGYLLIWGYFYEDRPFLDIGIRDWKRVNKQIYNEMYKCTTSILNKMDIDYKQPEK